MLMTVLLLCFLPWEPARAHGRLDGPPARQTPVIEPRFAGTESPARCRCADAHFAATGAVRGGHPPAFPSDTEQEMPQDAWFGEDKAKHLAMSFFTVAVTHAFGRAAGLENGPATAVGAATGVAAGLGQEWYDCRDYGVFSVRDLVWDAAGIALAVLFVRELR
jgi:uncharacterized protein YfiM (DUF2279 family)